MSLVSWWLATTNDAISPFSSVHPFVRYLPFVWVRGQYTLNTPSKVFDLPCPVSYVSRSYESQADATTDKVCQRCSEEKQVDMVFRGRLFRGFYRLSDQLYHQRLSNRYPDNTHRSTDPQTSRLTNPYITILMRPAI